MNTFNENTGYESTVVSSTHRVKPNPQREKHQSRTRQLSNAAEADFTSLMECIRNKTLLYVPPLRTDVSALVLKSITD